MTELIKNNWFKLSKFLATNMTKFLALEIVTSGCVYLFVYADPAGASMIIAIGGGLKGWQNTQKPKTDNTSQL